MDSIFAITYLKFRVAEIEDLVEIKEKRIREFDEKSTEPERIE